MSQEVQLHKQPFKPFKNNRKMTACRAKMYASSRVQSIPIFKEEVKSDGYTYRIFKGYKYIFHKY